MRKSNAILLGVALIMGLMAAFLARNWLRAQSHFENASNSNKTIVVASRPLAFGTAVTPEDVAEVPWAANALPDGAFIRKDLLFEGGRRVVLAPLATNEPILRSKITRPGQRASLSSLLQVGYRAVTVRVDDVRGVAGFILPGDFVDVVLIKSDDEHVKRESYSEILLQHLKVLAIDQLASEQQEHPTVAKAVTLEVAAEQAQKILLATNIGKLSLILRQPGEESFLPTRRITEKDLGRPKPVVETPVRQAVAPPPPPIGQPPNTVTVEVIRSLKRQDYVVRRDLETAGLPDEAGLSTAAVDKAVGLGRDAGTRPRD